MTNKAVTYGEIKAGNLHGFMQDDRSTDVADAENPVSSKFYFTYGTDPQFPYQNGWTEVVAPDLKAAIEAFKVYHPNRPDSDCINCSFYYTAEEFETPDNIMLNRESGDKCHERIILAREVLDSGKSDL